MKLTTTLAVAGLLLTGHSGLTQSTNWMKQQTAGGEACTQDIFQNAYSAGKLTGTQIIEGTSYTSAGNNDLVIYKRDVNGNLIWLQQYGGSGNEIARSIAKGTGNNLWIAGTFSGSFTAGPYTLNSAGSNDVFLLQIDPMTGDVMNAIGGGGTGNESVYGIEVLDNGDVYIAGAYDAPITMGGVTLSTSANWTPFVFKLNSSGNVLWGKDITNSAAWSMTADNSGSVYISGFSTSASISIAGTSVAMNGNNHFTTKLDANGSYQWAALSDYNGEITGLDADDNGNVYFAGNYDTQATFDNIALTGNGGDEVLIGKINSSGSYDWVYSMGSGGTDNALQTSVDHQGNAYFTGGVSGTVDFMGTNISGKFVAKFDAAGNKQWVTTIPSGTVVWKSIDAIGNRVLVTAYGNGFLTFGNDTLTVNATDFMADLYGDANRITGTIFLDDNANGSFDMSESGIPNAIVQTTPFAVASSNAQGVFDLYVNDGTFTTSMPNPPLYHAFTSPNSYTHTFVGTGGIEDSVDFGLSATPNMNDLRVSITSITAPKAGFVLGYHVSYKNVGTTDQNATLTFTADNTLNYFVSNPPETSSAGNVYTYDLGLLTAQSQGEIFIYFTIPSTTNVGTLLNTSVDIAPSGNDETPLDNADNQLNMVVAAYDPNYKAVDVDTIVDLSTPSYLEYEIHFQNLGTAPATDVLLVDTIDTDYLDLATLEIVSTSHQPMSLQLENNRIVKFYFNNINLPDSASNALESVGYVKFRIQQNGTLPLGERIENFADIYFDFNEAVRTDTAYTLHTTLGISELEASDALRMYPNPTTQDLNIRLDAPGVVGDIRIYDMKGCLKVMHAGESVNQGGTIQIDVSTLSPGSYMVAVDFDGKTLRKLLIVH